MGIETALIIGFLGAAYMTLQTSEKIKKNEDEISATIIALAYLPEIAVFYSGYIIAEKAALSAVANVYLGAFFLSIVLYLGFLYMLVQTYRQRIQDEGLKTL